jgi:V8-like Glu-specific endopeptidase
MIRFRVMFSCLIIAGGLAAVAVPVSLASAADRPDARSAPCQTVDVTLFSKAEQQAALNYWTPQRMAAARPASSPNGIVSDVPAGTTTVCVPITAATSSSEVPAPAPRGSNAQSTFFNGYPADGEIFYGRNRVCSGSVINGGGNHLSLILTAAHCVRGRRAGDFVYVPEYHSGQAPLGKWSAVGVASHYANDEEDYAFLVVQKHSGIQVGTKTGANRYEIDFNTSENGVRLVGYPLSDRGQRALTTLGNAFVIFPTPAHNLPYWTMATPGFSDGTSGSPWLINFNARTRVGIAIGDIGGYQQGGIHPSPSYSSSWVFTESNFLAVLSAADRIRN